MFDAVNDDLISRRLSIDKNRAYAAMKPIIIFKRF